MFLAQWVHKLRCFLDSSVTGGKSVLVYRDGGCLCCILV